MSTPNPLAPQGSLLEKQGRGRSTVQIISFIGAVHICALCGLLWIGCKKDDQSSSSGNNPDPLGGQPGLADPGYAANYDLPPLTNPPAGALGMPGASAGPVGGPTAGPTAGPVADPLPPLGGPGGIGAFPADTGGYATPPGAVTEHVVATGDTGMSIARKYGVPFSALKAANPSIDWNRLKLKQALVVPAPGSGPATGAVAGAGGTLGAGGTTPPPAGGALTYTVKPGDTGTRIATKHGVTWKAIRAANGLNSDVIKPGQKLKIPAKSGATGATAPSGAPSATPLPTGIGR
jgi:LysM repeat protein